MEYNYKPCFSTIVGNMYVYLEDILYGDYKKINERFPNYINKYFVEFQPPQNYSAQNQPKRFFWGRPFGFQGRYKKLGKMFLYSYMRRILK